MSLGRKTYRVWTWKDYNGSTSQKEPRTDFYGCNSKNCLILDHEKHGTSPNLT